MLPVLALTVALVVSTAQHSTGLLTGSERIDKFAKLTKAV